MSKMSRSSYNCPGYQTSNKKDCATKAPLTQDPVAPVQPTDNPYHWEAANVHSKISLAKASWSRTNEVVQTRAAGPPKRNSAVRWSGKWSAVVDIGTKRAMSDASDKTAGSTSGPRVLPLSKFKMHRSFSFEIDAQSERVSDASEPRKKEKTTSKATASLDSSGEQDANGRSSQFHEELGQQPPVPRTFPQILGEPFVPTALIEGK